MNFTKYYSILALVLVTLASSLIFWLAFYYNLPGKIGFPATTLETIFANYDGPNYLIISKCGYSSQCIRHRFSLPSPLEYYPAHFPFYPLLIKYYNLFTAGPKAMLLATLSGSLFLSLSAYAFFSLFLSPPNSFWLSFLLIFFPARLFVLHQIGAPETWLLAAILSSIYFFKTKKYFLSALMLALAQAFKSPAILLFIVYLFFFIKDLFSGKDIKKYFWYLLVPLTIGIIFSVYRVQTGDFWAYFHSGDNFHLSLPYRVFFSQRSWINTVWLDDVIYLYLLSFGGVYILIKKFRFDPVSLFSAIFLAAAILVAHRDLSRYLVPLYPFLLLAYAKYLTTKPAKIIFLFLIPAIVLFAINFIIGNTAPVADWTPYV